MRSKNPIIPACLVLSAENFLKRVNFAAEVGNSIHIDVIDGKFANGRCIPIEDWPEFSLGYVEAHLMVKEPLSYLQKLKKRGVTRAIIHIESQYNLAELENEARSLDILLGFAVNPDTDLSLTKRFLGASNYIQVMGVIPGKTGQVQQPQTVSAVSYFAAHNPRLVISVDGGVNFDNITNLKSAGAQYFVASSVIYDEGDWVENYREISHLIIDDNKRA